MVVTHIVVPTFLINESTDGVIARPGKCRYLPCRSIVLRENRGEGPCPALPRDIVLPAPALTALLAMGTSVYSTLR